MCMDAMDCKRSCDELTPWACRRQKCTKWRKKMVFCGEGEKPLKKWRTDSATIRKRRPKRKTYDTQACSVSFASRYKAKNISAFMKLRSGVIPSGTMAPDNTTQYLMHIVYQDLLSDDDDTFSSGNLNAVIDFSGRGQNWSIYGDVSTPQHVYSSLDSVYENTLEFQERDFENMFQIYSDSC